jgi:hypothetical protein
MAHRGRPDYEDQGARILIMARSLWLRAKAGYIDADRLNQTQERACRPGAGHTFASLHPGYGDGLVI